MFEFRPCEVKPGPSFEERTQAFGEWFDMDVDPSVEVSQLAKRLGETLEHIFGPELTASAMITLVRSGQGGDDWRELLEEFDNYSEWRLGSGLIDLLAYAVFGLVDGAPSSKAEAELTDAMVRARALIDSCVVDGWLETSEGSPLQATVTMAEGRRDFDSRRSIAPEALALLGVVKLSRIRNMISGNAPDLPRDEVGKVLHEPAAAWLAKREAFLPTVWRDLPQEGLEKVRPSFVSPVFVPVARDGSIFHPGQRRDGGYQIGPKDDPENIEDFNTALAALQHADVARWRRPNPKGNWGLVSAVEWRRMERAELEALAE